MATEIKLPDLGENIESGTVVNVLVAEGDQIEVEQSIVEIETDKAVIEVPSTAAGKVLSVDVSAGDEVITGSALISVEADEGASEEEPATQKKPAPSEDAETEPEESEPQEEPEKPEPEAKDEQPKSKPVESEKSVAPSQLVPAAPSVRRFAREIGVDIAKVAGSGPSGRITVDDIKVHARALAEKRTTSASEAKASSGLTQRELPDFSKWGEIEREKLSRLRMTVADNMANAWNTIPHVTQEDRADVTELEQWRKKNGVVVEAEGGKLTVTSIALKIVAAALRKFPQFNASIDVQNDEIIYKKSVHIGVAVDTDRGLLVPVIRDTDRKSLVDLSVELTELAEKARDSKLSLDDMQGGTFTITNLGGLGTTQFSPIVNWPQVAILGISRGSFQPTWNNETKSFEPRLMLPLSISYDHRIIDGADAARFLRWIARAFEEPFLMI